MPDINFGGGGYQPQYRESMNFDSGGYMPQPREYGGGQMPQAFNPGGGYEEPEPGDPGYGGGGGQFYGGGNRPGSYGQQQNPDGSYEAPEEGDPGYGQPPQQQYGQLPSRDDGYSVPGAGGGSYNPDTGQWRGGPQGGGGWGSEGPGGFDGRAEERARQGYPWLQQQQPGGGGQIGSPWGGGGYDPQQFGPGNYAGGGYGDARMHQYTQQDRERDQQRQGQIGTPGGSTYSTSMWGMPVQAYGTPGQMTPLPPQPGGNQIGSGNSWIPPAVMNAMQMKKQGSASPMGGPIRALGALGGMFGFGPAANKSGQPGGSFVANLMNKNKALGSASSQGGPWSSMIGGAASAAPAAMKKPQGLQPGPSAQPPMGPPPQGPNIA